MPPSAETPSVTVNAPDGGVPVTLARMEAKIDVVLAQHEAKIDQHSDDLQDHETRIRTLESTPTVSPRALWTTIGSVVVTAGGALALLDRLTA